MVWGENSGTISATGGSAMKAVEVIMEHGVPEDRIIFINLVRVPFRGPRHRDI